MLSIQARGLLDFLYTDWDQTQNINTANLMAACPSLGGRDKTRDALRELIEAGILDEERRQIKGTWHRKIVLGPEIQALLAPEMQGALFVTGPDIQGTVNLISEQNARSEGVALYFRRYSIRELLTVSSEKLVVTPPSGEATRPSGEPPKGLTVTKWNSEDEGQVFGRVKDDEAPASRKRGKPARVSTPDANFHRDAKDRSKWTVKDSAFYFKSRLREKRPMQSNFNMTEFLGALANFRKGNSSNGIIEGQLIDDFFAIPDHYVRDIPASGVWRKFIIFSGKHLGRVLDMSEKETPEELAASVSASNEETLAKMRRDGLL